MLRPTLVLGLSVFLGCGGDDDASSGDFVADVSVDGETTAFSSGCTLSTVEELDGYGLEALDTDSDSGIYGVTVAWPAPEVSGPGEHDLSSLGVIGAVIRPSADGDGVTYSSVSAGTITFEEYDPDERVAGVITDLLMERSDPDDTIVVEIAEASFVCEA